MQLFQTQACLESNPRVLETSAKGTLYCIPRICPRQHFDMSVGDRVQSRDDYRATVMYVGSVAGATPEEGWIGLQVVAVV